MRLSVFFLFVAIVQSFATVSYSQQTRFNLKMQNASVIDVLNEIENTSDFYFLFNKNMVDVERKVSVNVENKRVEDILTDLFAGTNVNYVVIDRQIVLTTKTSEAQQTQGPVDGKVTDRDGQSLPGVTVFVKGTTQGTITDVNGKYNLPNIPANATLVFSFVGMKTQEIVVGDKTQINIVLDIETIGVDEVVVTALGFKREEKALGYAVQKVSGENITTVKGIDLGTSLSGKVAGMLVKNSTEFTAEPDIQIRGESPLLVIDGVPYGNMSLRDLPSDDIEDINVLKGATASALYGYRGASGAIMITTKRGSKDKGLSVSVNSGTMFTAGYLAIPEMQSTFGRVVNTATNTYVRSGDGSWGVPMDGRDVIQWDPISKSMKAMPYLPIGKDNFKNFLEQGYILNNNINVVQQGEYGSLRTSATWVRNKGQYPNSMFDKFTYSMGGDMKFNKFILSSTMSYNKQTSPNTGFGGYTGYDPMYNILVWSATDYDIRDYKDYWLVKNESQNSSYTSTNNNPYFDRYERTHSINRDIFNGTLSLTYNLTSWLKATVRTGFDTYSDRQEVQISKGSFQGGGTSTVIANGTQIWGESAKGSYNIGLGRGYSLNNDFLLSGDKKLGNFTLDGFIGGTIYYRQDEGIEARTQGGLSIPGFYSLKASINPVAVNSSVQKQQVNSLFGRMSVSWKNLLFAEGTLRNDWSSTLPESTRSYLYPSIAASFIASELLPEMDWLSLWKLRGSWTSSKTPAGIYSINSVYTITTNAWGSLSSATYPTTIRGTDVLPESASTLEIGTVVNVYKNRASLDVSYYSKKMYDFLRSTGVSPASGYSANYINIDEEITRRGIEITANVTPVKTSEWKWDISFNWTKYARYYTKLDENFSADKPWVKVGERADHYILRDYQRDPEGNIIHNNGQPLYSAYDSKFGYADPDWIWGANSGVKYKNWQFTVSVDGRVGGLAQTTTEMYMWRAGSHPKSVVPERYLDATQPGTKNYIGEGVKVVSGSATYDTYGNITSDTRVYAANDVPVTYKTYLENYHKGTAWGGSPSPVDAYSTTFFKIREMSLTYELPRNWCNKFYAKSASISAVGQNVYLWAKQFKYSDPDGGSENFSDPSQRYLGFNLKLNF
ncbi:MAG: TonB-dependent receptor [Bacteroidetes bacterium GWF2_42_66]|nr:MAG: TonB-dependent receptor [Bacteroidetes bacterium GWA2_42_15]OFX99761.1 MAG: TonB-dependent receptor [Bacteroidetes bacterium GWE2_42_39]OFY39799.1 MAG: TonB-dependent receptor [Bacteroidetes bacterium GWF2_42_66]HBL74812.1 SusC/RagA family TonB-linked outer membrane protein [Prolixibacteraceae bacterium]HCR90565.1 SusC/RagA family TonB-linked outer membrane protein [Prolixibacteraceae bacterium]